MFEELRKKSFQKCVILAVLFLLAGANLIIFDVRDAYYSVFGCVDFTTLEPDEIKSQLVEFDLTANFGCYLEEYEYNSDTYKRRTTSLYYIIWTGDDLSPDFRYMTVKVPASMQKSMDTMADKISEGLSASPVHIFGKIKKLDNEEYSYFTESLTSAGWSQQEIQDYTLPYYIDYAYKDSTLTVSLLMLGAGVVLLGMGIFRIVKGKTGGYLKKLHEDIGLSGYSQSYLESDYASAQTYDKKGDIRMGQLMTYFCEGSQYRAVPHNKVSWAYQSTTTHRTNGIKTGTTYSIVYYAEGCKKPFCMAVPNETTAQDILKRLADTCPWIIVGYSDKLQTLFRNNREQFLQLRYNTMEHDPTFPMQ